MKRRRFSEEQIVGLLKEHQAGLGAQELCRKHGVSDATFINGDPSMAACLARQGIAERCPERVVSDAQKVKALEAETTKRKKPLAEQMMDVSTLKEMLGKNV